MAANSLLKQYSDERAALVQNAVSKAAAIILGRRRVLSGIRWRDDLIITAAEAIGGVGASRCSPGRRRAGSSGHRHRPDN